MILKDADDRLDEIAQLETLRDTSPRSARSAIEKQIANIRSGAAGERNAAYFLDREFKHSENVLVLHDLRLGVDGDFAQIDHLLIHRLQRAAWVLETKNYSGRLSCDEHGDWTIWRNGKPVPIPSPVNQARRHCETLRAWLEANGQKPLNKIHPVVLISPTSSVNRSKLPADSHVVKSDNFIPWWHKQAEAIGLGTALSMVGRHVLEGLSPEMFRALGEHLARAHVPTKYDWRARFGSPPPAAPRAGPPEPGAGSRSSPDDPVAEVPLVLATAHGEVTVTRLPDGRYALRNEKNDALIELVKRACKGKARWNPRFRNWLIEESELPGIRAVLNASDEDQQIPEAEAAFERTQARPKP